jgi:type I restriction enzyme S subunit
MIEFMPPTWRMVKLGVCLQRRKNTVMPSTLSDASIGLVGLEDIQGGGRGGITIRPTKPQEIESLKTRFVAGDILYGKLRPYLNKVGIAHRAGLCSTEIWAFGPSALVDSQFAAFFLASSFFVDRVASLTKGANLPRLDTEAFDSTEIPLPPLSEQQRIVEILQEAEAIRRLRAEAEAKTAELIPAMFYEALDKNEASRKRPLGHWFETKPNYGTMTPADEVTGSDGVVCLRVGNIQNNRIDLSDRKYVQRGAIHPERHTVKTGDIVLARAIASEEHLGKAVVITPQEDGYAFDSHLMRIRLRKAELVPEFLQVYLYSAQGRNAFLKQARQSAVQFNVNAEEMARVMVPDVELIEQQKVVQAIKEGESICKALGASNTQNSQLDAALSARAFSGQLTADWRKSHKDNKSLLSARAGLFSRRLSHSIGQHAIKTLHATTDGRANIIKSELTREQRVLLLEIERMLNEGGGRYFTAEQIANYVEGTLHRNPQGITAHLLVFVTCGIVIPVSRRRKDSNINSFAACYRLSLKAIQIGDSNSADEALEESSAGDDIKGKLMEIQRRLATGNI